MDKAINPHDILFVVGNNEANEYEGMQQEYEGIEAVEGLEEGEELMDCQKHGLDLSKYRNMTGRLVQTASVLNTCKTADCCELKVNYQI